MSVRIYKMWQQAKNLDRLRCCSVHKGLPPTGN